MREIETVNEETNDEFDNTVNRLLKKNYKVMWETYKFKIYEIGYNKVFSYSIVMFKES